MAAAVQIAGACEIKVATNGGSLQSLGYTRNFADVTKEAFWVDVPGDENGGDEGPPIEIIYLGEIARVRLELTKWDATVAAIVKARLSGGTAGTPGSTGTAMFAGSKDLRLLLNAANDPRNFPRAIPRGSIEIGRGSKYSTLVCEFECHKDGSGVLYNTTTS